MLLKWCASVSFLLYWTRIAACSDVSRMSESPAFSPMVESRETRQADFFVRQHRAHDSCHRTRLQPFAQISYHLPSKEKKENGQKEEEKCKKE